MNKSNHKFFLIASVLMMLPLFLIGCKEKNLDSEKSSDFGALIVAAEISKAQGACSRAGFHSLGSCASSNNYSSSRLQARIALTAQNDFLKNCSEIIGDFKCKELLSNAYLFSQLDD